MLNRLKLNLNEEKKTNYISFSLINVNKSYFNCIKVKNVKEIENVKYVGDTIDRHLKWYLHVIYLYFDF